MAITLRYFSEFGKPVLQKTIYGGIDARIYCIFTACTMSYFFTVAISSPDEFLVIHCSGIFWSVYRRFNINVMWPTGCAKKRAIYQKKFNSILCVTIQEMHSLHQYVKFFT